MSYLEKLKSKIKKTGKAATPPTVKTVLSTFDSNDSRGGSRISEKQKYDALWKKAWALADWIDDSDSTVSWQERAAKVPELQEMSIEIDRLETLIDVEQKNKTATKHRAENRLNSLEGFSPFPKFPEPKKTEMGELE